MSGFLVGRSENGQNQREDADHLFEVGQVLPTTLQRSAHRETGRDAAPPLLVLIPHVPARGSDDHGEDHVGPLHLDEAHHEHGDGGDPEDQHEEADGAEELVEPMQE
ncbi:MAG: hypothetical protein HQ488_03705 [Parcubacteria group bacterium]|nr:hypothetical protein [Parcubacteria group bacterium]